MSAAILAELDSAMRTLKQRLDADTGQTFLVRFNMHHADFRFEYTDTDSAWSRLGPSHDLLELNTPQAWRAMVAREGDMILANWRHTFRMG